MDDIERQLEGMGMGQAFDLTQQALLRTEIEQIQMLTYDYLNADKLGDTMRKIRIFRILVSISKKKQDLTSLQTYYGGKRIGLYRNTITDENAREWVLNMMEDVRHMNDWRVKATPMSERIHEAKDEYDDDQEIPPEEVNPEHYPNGTFEMEPEAT